MIDQSKHKLPLVTVIIPCFNREKYIVETIESVINQTWPSVELIVVDDGCTDGSRFLLENYSDRIVLLEHPNRVNCGQSAAINLGLKNSHGEFIAILDSDDLFAADKIEKQVLYLLNNPQVGLVYSNGYAIDSKGIILNKFYNETHIESSDPNRVLMDCYFLLPNNALVRDSVYKTVGYFDESLRSAQDHDMAIRIAECTQISYLDAPVFFYRRHLDSISQKNAKLRWQNGYKILLKSIKRHNYHPKVILKRLAVLNFRLAQCYLEDKKIIKSILLFLAAGICDPFRSLRVLRGYEKVTSPH